MEEITFFARGRRVYGTKSISKNDRIISDGYLFVER
jgi:hypothetical protein